jgi:hypothetical protein
VQKIFANQNLKHFLDNWRKKVVEEEKREESAVQAEIPPSFKIERRRDW